MATESATFTALPNGLHESGDFYRVTIFVTPRLLTDGAGVLGMSNVDYPAFFDWPATLAGTVFGLELDNIGSVETVPDPDMPPPDSATWHALFDKTSVRDGEVRDFANTRFTSFPVADATKYMLDLYREVAEGYPSAFPPITVGPLAGLVADIGNLSQFGRARYYPILEGEFTEVHHSQGEGVKDRVWRYVDRSRFPVDAQGNKDPLLVFAEAYRFHDRPGARELAALDPVYPEPKPPDIDFHGFVSFCGDYPKLMRRLGLAVDVLMKRPPNIKVEDKVRVEVRDAPPAALPWMQTEAARPWTNYETKGRLFLARPKDREGDLVDGMLRLEWAWRFPVNQIDVDGGALKTVDFAGNLQRLYEHLQGRNGVSMTDDAASLPALRSSGFMVSRDARTAKIVAHLDNVAQNTDHHAQDQAIELFAEDVNRGHRLDIEDQTKPGRWRSLHQRIGDYQLQQADNSKVPLPVEISPDEGYVKGASMSAVPEKEDDQYLHEAMFGWEGWSLAAKRPGQAIRNMDVAEPVKDDANENPYPMPLVTHFEPVPGSLPRLRIGRAYRFRARAVDLAGNSVRDEDIDPNHVTTAHTWQRWDPVPSPAVVPRRQFTEGESLMRMVIRSTLDLLPPAYVAQSRIVDLPGHETEALRYLDVNDRHIAPPIGSQQLAEWHAKFDAAVGESAADPTLDAQFAIAARESGSFLHAGPNVFTVNPSHPDQLTPLPIGDEKGAHLNPGEYVCHDVDELDLPYLPDPLSIGASFTSLPGQPGTRLQQWEPTTAGEPWYDRRPLRVRIQDGSGPPVYDASTRLLTVRLPQAELVTVNLASYLEEGVQELFGQWMLQRPVFRSQSSRRTDAREGRNWLLTPWSELTLVHAVEKPLTAPEIHVPASGLPNTGVRRSVGETFAVLSGVVQNHAKSTGRLDVEAAWDEPIDDVLKPAPETTTGTAHVGDLQLTATEDACRIDRNDGPAIGANPPTHKLRHEFHDTKHRYVRYRATATTRFREYFPPTITNDRELITHAGPEALLDVPSSRRPDPPDVLYVVPTWTWTERTVRGLVLGGRKQRLPSTQLRTRTGGGLRVYMNRPWYSSGVDELLGVVLEDQPWITWPIDLGAGLHVAALSKAHAEAFAEQVFADQVVKPAGKASATASERLLAAVTRAQKLPRAANPRAQQSVLEATMTSHTAALSETSVSAAQSAALVDIVAKFFFPSGDPQKFITHWGRDPVWGSESALPGPYIHQFPLRVDVGTDISLLEAPGHTVAVVGHQPEYDAVRGLWYCDLQLDAGSSYFPFVKLALARYQSHSIPGQQLSKVVLPDFTQLVAERTAALTKIGRSGVAVSLRGPGGFTKNALELTPDPNNRLGLSRFAVAQIERLPVGATTDLAWSAVGDEVRLDLSDASGLADVVHTGTLPLPARAEGEQLRVALREYEIFETDVSERDDFLIRPISFADFSVLQRPVKYRLVYADHLAL